MKTNSISLPDTSNIHTIYFYDYNTFSYSFKIFIYSWNYESSDNVKDLVNLHIKNYIKMKKIPNCWTKRFLTENPDYLEYFI